MLALRMFGMNTLMACTGVSSRSRVSGHIVRCGVVQYSKLVGEWSFSFGGRYHVYLTAARSRNNMTPESGALFGGSLRSSNHSSHYVQRMAIFVFLPIPSHRSFSTSTTRLFSTHDCDV